MHVQSSGSGGCAERSGSHTSVLIVDDDLGTRETFDWALRSSGIRVRTSGSGRDAISLAKAGRFDLLLLDLELGDMRGTDVIRTMRTDGDCAPFVLMSAFLTTEVTVEAMRLGAIDVVDKPISVDDLPTLIHTAVSCVENVPASRAHPGAISLAGLKRCTDTVTPRSAAERWVLHVIKGCIAGDDPRTVRLWTASAGAGYTPLRDNCSLVGIDPHDARDLMRMLRVVLHTLAYGSGLETLLDTGDSRTLAKLIERAGFRSAADLQSATIEEFFRRQHFVASHRPAVVLLRDFVLQHTR
jgi:CheY-like chemotaxis protein